MWTVTTNHYELLHDIDYILYKWNHEYSCDKFTIYIV